MACLSFVAPSLVLAVTILLISVEAEMTSRTFRRYNVEPIGCSVTTTRSKHLCCVQCSTSSNCVTYSFVERSHTCTRCFETNTTAISFSRLTYHLRTASLFQSTSHGGNFAAGPVRFMIKVQGTLIKTVNSEWYFLEITATQNGVKSLMMKMTLDSSNYVQLIAYVNSVWTSQYYYMSPVIFSVDTYLDTTILVSASVINIYFNSLFCCNYPVLVPRGDTVGVGVYGGINLTELSI
ncbi:hypothetical protein Btru_055104 [Bulinus truncatus]|nr:hypothetical protein Btru_055104 [Bulinus truncatus]